MTLKNDIEAAGGDPAGLERLYRTAQADGNDTAFREALRQCVADRPDDIVLKTWAYRLDVPVEREEEDGGQDRRWWAIIGASVLLGVASALLARGKPPVPFTDEADMLFRVAWGPLVAVVLLAYLAWAGRSTNSLTRYAAASAAVVGAALYVGLTIGAEGGDVALLAPAHLLFVSWAAVGVALCLGYPNPARQSYAYLVKSVEAVLTGGIFFGAGLIFVGLTFAIFAVLGVELPDEDLVVVAAFGVGCIPLLAIGSAYDASASPLAQEGHSGLTRTLQILTRLLLPLALGVLLVYVLWFIPVYFRKPFEERDVLIAYNATILAIMVLLTVVVCGPADARSSVRRSLFRYAVLGLGVLTLILNVYALAAVAGRSIESGLTPNRFTVMGWNVTTLSIMAAVGVRLWRSRRQDWIPVFRASIGSFAGLAAVWAVLLLVVLPFFQ